MYRQEKSHLTYQVEGRLSAYLCDIDDCEEFSSTSKTKLEKTMKMTECFHSLLGHIKANCISDNRALLDKNKFIIDVDAENQTQYFLTWTPIQNTKTISGFLKITFLTPDLTLFTTSNFKSESIEGLTNLIIDLTTLTFATETNKVQQELVIVKTLGLETITKENAQLIKSELETYCEYNGSKPTFLYLKHKDNVGHFHKHYSNCEKK
jgi:hypothetical protein